MKITFSYPARNIIVQRTRKPSELVEGDNRQLASVHKVTEQLQACYVITHYHDTVITFARWRGRRAVRWTFGIDAKLVIPLTNIYPYIITNSYFI